MQNFGQGLMIALIGYVLVFVVLCFLWGILEIMRIVFAPKKKNNVKTQLSAENVEKTAPVAANVPEETDEEELVAVLTAAVAASLNTSAYNLKIKSFRRVDTIDNAWSSASRVDAVNKL